LTDLYVFGTTGNDTILVNPGTVAGTVTVTMNSVLIGTFSPTGRIIIYGRSGAGTSDSIGVSSQITLPAWIYGDAGTDVLWGGGGPNIEIAGTGTDTLYGGLGRNILISGSGSDELVGGSGDGLLIGGTTSYNANDMALQAIMNEWNSSDSYATRVSHVTGKAGGLNGSYYFDAATVSGGGADTLVAGNANDVFFQALGDTVLNRRASETLVSVP
jgi:Ca2+-binding RTX toxin-like protein